MQTTPSLTADERPLVLLAQPLFPEFAATLAGRYRLVLAADADVSSVAEARVLLVPGLKTVAAEHLARLPAVELVLGTSVGVDHVDLDVCRRRGLTVTNAGAAFADDSADYAVGLVVGVLRRMVAADAYVRRGRWAADGGYPLATKHTTGVLPPLEKMPSPAQPPNHQSAAAMPLVLLADPIIPEFELELSARYRLLPAAEIGADTAASATALLTVDLSAVTAEIIGALPKLELVAASSVGVDHVDIAACRRHGIVVTNAGDGFSTDTADYAVGMLITALRRVTVADAYIRRGSWPASGDYSNRQGERQASGDRGARQHRLPGRAAPRRLRVRRILPLEVAQAFIAVHVRPLVAGPRRRQRRPGALLRADGGDEAHGGPGGDGGAGEGRGPGQRRPRRPRRRAGAGQVPAGGRPWRRRAGRVRERAGRAAGAVRHGQRRAVGPQGRDHAGVLPRRARGRHRQPRRLLLREATPQSCAALNSD